MPRIERSIEIEAPRAEVFAYATKEESQVAWVSFLKEYQITSEEKQGRGVTERAVIQIGPRAEETRTVWSEYVPEHLLARRSTSGFQMESRLRFSTLEDGTRVAWTIDYTPPMGPLGRVVDLFLMRRLFINQVEDSLERLKRHFEEATA